jgi:hypothetical protein
MLQAASRDANAHKGRIHVTCIRTPSINIPFPDRFSSAKTTIIVRDTTFSVQSTWVDGGEDMAFHSDEDKSLNIYMTPRSVCMHDADGSRVHLGLEYVSVGRVEGEEDHLVSFNFFGEARQVQIEMADQTHLLLYICLSLSSESPSLILTHPHEAPHEPLAVKLKFPYPQTLETVDDRFYFTSDGTIRPADNQESVPASEEERV